MVSGMDLNFVFACFDCGGEVGLRATGSVVGAGVALAEVSAGCCGGEIHGFHINSSIWLASN